jgi:hypothetical protein
MEAQKDSGARGVEEELLKTITPKTMTINSPQIAVMEFLMR